MKKCEVLADTCISVKKGSIVYVDDRQFELAKRVLKPVGSPQADAPAKETRKSKKTK